MQIAEETLNQYKADYDAFLSRMDQLHRSLSAKERIPDMIGELRSESRAFNFFFSVHRLRKLILDEAFIEAEERLNEII
jgi:hypothetical protein